MAAERPSLDQLYTQTVGLKRPSLDDIYAQTVAVDKPATKGRSKGLKIPSGFGMSGAVGINPETIKEAYYKSPEYAPDAGQMLGNVAGASVGALAMAPTGGAINPQSGAAIGGMAGRGFGEFSRQLAYLPNRPLDFGKIKQQTELGGAGEIFGAGAAKLLERAAPWAAERAKRLVTSVLKPTGKLAQKSGQLAETVLEEGLARGTKQDMLEGAYKKLGQRGKQVEDILSTSRGSVSPEKAIQNLDNLAAEYRAVGANDDADYILKLKDDLIQAHNLQSPVTKVVETPGFVLPKGSESKMTRPAQKNVPLAGRAKKSALEATKPARQSAAYDDPATGTMNKSVVSDEPQIGRRYVETPDDTVIIPRKNKQATVAYPERTTQTRSKDVFGPSKKETVKVGTKNREIPLTESNEIKKGQYRYLEGKRADGAYGAETKSPEVKGRQSYARGFREGIEDVVPEVGPLNRSAASLIDVSDALQNRIGVSERQNLFGLGDMMFGTASFVKPEALGIAVGRKALGTDTAKNFMARNLYGLSKSQKLKALGELVKSPSARALLSREMSYLNN